MHIHPFRKIRAVRTLQNRIAGHRAIVNVANMSPSLTVSLIDARTCCRHTTRMAIDEHALYTMIGSRINTRRRALQFTQQYLAERLEIKRTSIANIEAGSQRPPLHLLYRCCEVLQMDLADLLPPISSISRMDATERVDVGGQSAEMPPMAASLVRELLRQLPEGK